MAGKNTMADADAAEHFSDIDIGRVAPPKAPAGFLQVTVTDPVLVENGPMEKYVNFTVNTHSDRADFVNESSMVFRRFSDFVKLHEILGHQYPGAIIPPLPPKNLSDRFIPQFYNARALALQKFLVKVAAHYELSGSRVFIDFLQDDDTKEDQDYTHGWLNAKDQFKKSKPPVHEGVLQGFMHNFTKVKHTLNLSKASSHKTPMDIKFEELSSRVLSLESNVHNMARYASDLVRKSTELGMSLKNFGSTFEGLAQAESGQLQTMLDAVATTSNEIAAELNTEAERENNIFESPVYEYLMSLKAVRQAITEKDERKVAYLTGIGHLEGKQNAHNKLKKQPAAGGEMDISSAEAAVNQAHSSMMSLKDVYEQACARCMREVEAFMESQGEEIRKIVVDYVNLQIEYNQIIAEKWQSLLPSLEHAAVGAGAENAFVALSHGLLTGSTQHHDA